MGTGSLGWLSPGARRIWPVWYREAGLFTCPPRGPRPSTCLSGVGVVVVGAFSLFLSLFFFFPLNIFLEVLLRLFQFH